MAVSSEHTPEPPPDSWTPDQESALLKALVHYKPVGLHAHFRMISIRNSLLNSGTIDPEAAHTRIPGIWAKLKTLYDLEQLNEREDAVFTSLGEEEDDDNAIGNKDKDSNMSRSKRSKGQSHGQTASATKTPGYWRDFELPTGDDDGEGFESLMWERRLDPQGTPDGSEWDRRSQSQAKGGGGETTDEPRSSPAGRGTRSGRKGRVNRLKDEMEIDSPTSGRGSRRTSKAASEVEVTEDEDHTMDDGEDEDEEDADNDQSEDQDDEGDENRGSNNKRGRGGGRGRGKRGRKRK